MLSVYICVTSRTCGIRALQGEFESLQFFHYGQKSHHMTERVGYDLTKGSVLILAKESKHYSVHLHW